MLPVLLLALAYLIGSIPFSFLVVKLSTGSDIRQFGSHNVGATNAARTAGRAAGVIALLFDVAKGYLAVLLGRWMVARPDWPLAGAFDASPLRSGAFWIALAGLVAVLGHMFPLWLHFRGGKGVATGAGVFLGISPLAIAAAMIVFAIVLLASRIVSLASMIAAASVPLFLRYLTHAPFWSMAVSIVIALVIVLKHHENIARLAQGTEPRIGRDGQ